MSNLSDPKMIDNWVQVLGSMIERGEALHDLFPFDEVNAYSAAQFDAIASKLGLTKSMVMLAHKAAPRENNKESSPPIAAGAASPSVAVQPHVAPVVPPSVESKAPAQSRSSPPLTKSGDFFNAAGMRWYRNPSTGKTSHNAQLTNADRSSRWWFADGFWYISTRPQGDLEEAIVRMPVELRSALKVRNSVDVLPPIEVDDDPTAVLNGAPIGAGGMNPRPPTRSSDSGVLYRIGTREQPSDPTVKRHVKCWWRDWNDSKVAGWDHMSEDEKAGMFINWLNAKINTTRPPDRVKVAIIHEVAYKFQMTNNMALKVRHLNNVRRPRSYVDMGIQIFTEGSGYLGFTIRMT